MIRVTDPGPGLYVVVVYIAVINKNEREMWKEKCVE
jgi:hypothetical protein